MVISKFPSNGESDSSASDDKIKRPKFIVIDDTSEYLYGSSHAKGQADIPEDVFEQSQKIKTSSLKSSIFFRFISFFCANLCFWLMLSNLLWTACFFVLAALTLFRVSSLNQECIRFWNFFKAFLVITQGCILGIFNPALGIGLILLYLSFSSEVFDTSFLKKWLDVLSKQL